MWNLMESILFKPRTQIHVGKELHLLHYYQIKIIKNISDLEQGHQILQKNSG